MPIFLFLAQLTTRVWNSGGTTLVVGAGNSGAEIALELARHHPTWLSGLDIGHVPIRIESTLARFLVIPVLFRFIFHRVLTLNTPIGRKNRLKILSHGMPLVRTKPADLAAAGIQRVSRTVGVWGGLPMLEDGRVLEVANIVWCNGFDPDFSWIDLPMIGKDGPIHERGVVISEPGLYFVGLTFLFAASSSMVHGVGRDAEYVVKAIQTRQRRAKPATDAGLLHSRADQRQAAARTEDTAQPHAS
jgi:putative flavoprotein involved in K+ transport